MHIQNFATIPAIRSTQFGREIFSGMLKFKELRNFLRVFPDVQRTANGRKISSIKKYILTWLNNPEEEMRFFSALTATTRGQVFYDEVEKKVAIDINFSKLSVNDGQHRLYGISEAIDELKVRESTAKNDEEALKIKEKRNQLENMSVVIVIFNQMSEKTEKQLFYDLNNLSSRPSKSANIRLTQRDLWSKLAVQLATEHPRLQELGVEMNKGVITGGNPNFVLLTTIYAMCKKLFHRELMGDKDFLTEHNYDDVYKDIVDHFTRILDVLPQTMNIKNKYILRRSFALRGISVFVREAYEDITIDKEDIYKAIERVNWLDDLDYWSKFGGFASKAGTVAFANNDGRAEPAIKEACFQELHKLVAEKKQAEIEEKIQTTLGLDDTN
jgi:DNA sulfur modification protein DndB